MRLVFRADASRQIGAGHVMRVTTIAQEAILRGYECHFVGAVGELRWVKDYVEKLGFQSINQSITQFGVGLENYILVLDSYTIQLDSVFNNLNVWKMVVCVTDQFTPRYCADIYVDQGLQNNVARENGLLLGGPDYALMRKTIKKSKPHKVFVSPPKILVLGGGSDPFGFVREVLYALNCSGFPFVAHVFSDENLEGVSDQNIIQHQLGPELDDLAGGVDLAITTASTSSIEFIAREIPTLIACAVDNQEKSYLELSKLGLALPIGVRNSVGVWHLDLTAIRMAITDHGLRLTLRERARGFIDLNGPSRVLDKIESFIANGHFRT